MSKTDVSYHIVSTTAIFCKMTYLKYQKHILRPKGTYIHNVGPPSYYSQSSPQAR